jgi:hypothetical protein
VGDELIGHPGQGHLGDVEPVLGDQLQQQVEGTGEVVEMDVEPSRLLLGRSPTVEPSRRLSNRPRNEDLV